MAMGFRWRKSVKILPGVRLNFSKSGVSTSLGPRGASVSVGRRGVHANVGLPGTGLSYRERLGGGGGRGRHAAAEAGPRPPGIVLPFLGFCLLFAFVAGRWTEGDLPKLLVWLCIGAAAAVTWLRRYAFWRRLRSEGERS
jgi:hypothetical protein